MAIYTILILIAILVIISIFDVFFLYGLISTFVFIVLLPFYFIVRVLNRKFLFGWKEKLGFFKAPDLGDKVIMYHGVSVGEVIALENLIKKTKEVFPDYKVVVTTGTKTGQEIAHKKYDNVADFITYFPFDITYCVNAFLNKVKPTVVLIAETELWPVFSTSCKKKGIYLYCINGRMSDSTFAIYKKFRFFFKYVLEKYTKILTQSEIDKDKLLAIGAPKERTYVMKNLKFDVKPVNETVDLGQDGYRVIIAGSTHKGEDEIILPIFKEKHQRYSDIKLLLVPRHIQRIPNIEEILKKDGLKYGFRSKGDTFKDYDVIILDTMGELSKMYKMCYFAFIGGSFNKTGGHNPLEATVYSKPTITGPSIHNFRDIYWLLARSNAGKIVKNPKELSDYMEKLLSDKDFYNQACKDCETIFHDQQGALDVVINELKQILK
ncbi:MAG: 3-deoxy-D-manno-octulosonic acid transferase [Cyanobacteriota bacterium]|nr:3-deoxy-D-manno-octulosonic acid transferase [Cyanobacteriota bacterium]MDY6382394.1 3-deoxy-D-manno-octulosonic acid transferase [Cyanobacteriota bacterium]